MFYAIDKAQNRVHIDTTLPGVDYFCPACGERLVCRRGQLKRHHFAHGPNTKCSDQWRYDPSDWHMAWQERFPDNCREVLVQHGKVKHFADVLCQNTVIEFQQGHITKREFQERNQFFSAEGHPVVWAFAMEEEFSYGNIATLPLKITKFKWDKPMAALEGFDPKESKDIKVYLENDEGKLVEISWAFPFGLARFAANHILSKEEFINKFCPGTVAKKAAGLTVDSIYDICYLFRDVHDDRCFYGCPLKPNYIMPEIPGIADTPCYSCQYHRNIIDPTQQFAIGCTARFRDIPMENISKVLLIHRDAEGKVVRIRVEENGTEKEYVIAPRIPYHSTTVECLWETYQCTVMRIVNIQTGMEAQIMRDPAPQIEKYHTVYGKIRFAGKDYTERTFPIRDFDIPVWRMLWFRR